MTANIARYSEVGRSIAQVGCKSYQEVTHSGGAKVWSEADSIATSTLKAIQAGGGTEEEKTIALLGQKLGDCAKNWKSAATARSLAAQAISEASPGRLTDVMSTLMLKAAAGAELESEGAQMLKKGLQMVGGLDCIDADQKALVELGIGMSGKSWSSTLIARAMAADGLRSESSSGGATLAEVTKAAYRAITNGSQSEVGWQDAAQVAAQGLKTIADSSVATQSERLMASSALKQIPWWSSLSWETKARQRFAALESIAPCSPRV